MIVIWTPDAEQDRMDIWDYIATDSPSAAEKLSDSSALLSETKDLSNSIIKLFSSW